MKIGDYAQMKSYLVRPGTPEQAKKAEENNKKYLADRRAKTMKAYGLTNPIDKAMAKLPEYVETYDTPLLHDPLSNSFKTENQIKFEAEKEQKHVVNTLNKFEDLPKKLTVPKKISNTEPRTLAKQVNSDTKDIEKEETKFLKSVYPKEASKEQVDYLANNLNKMKQQQKPFKKIQKVSTPIQIDTSIPSVRLLSDVIQDQPKEVPEARSNVLVENDPKYRNTIFGSDTYWRRKRGL